jgi:hypothetical protein
VRRITCVRELEKETTFGGSTCGEEDDQLTRQCCCTQLRTTVLYLELPDFALTMHTCSCASTPTCRPFTAHIYTLKPTSVVERQGSIALTSLESDPDRALCMCTLVHQCYLLHEASVLKQHHDKDWLCQQGRHTLNGCVCERHALK